MLLDAEPGSFETVRQFLGHKSLTTTVGSIRRHRQSARGATSPTSRGGKRSRPKSPHVGQRNWRRNKDFRATKGVPYEAFKRLYLPYADWPEDDRTRWEAAFKAGNDLFDDRDLQPISRSGRGCSYSMPMENFSLFSRLVTVACSRALPLNGSTARSSKTMSSGNQRSCGGITLGIYLYHLWFTLRYICPSEDWSWLLTISKRISGSGETKATETSSGNKRDSLCARHRIDGPCSSPAVSQPRAGECKLPIRDGLIIALLALIPLRRRTLAALRIGKHLVRSGDQWVLDIPAEDIKTKRPLEYPISAELSERIDIYLNQIRPRILGAGTHDYLWASSRGRPMGGRSNL